MVADFYRDIGLHMSEPQIVLRIDEIIKLISILGVLEDKGIKPGKVPIELLCPNDFMIFNRRCYPYGNTGKAAE